MDRTQDSDSGDAGSIPAGCIFDSQIAGGMLYVTPVTYFMAFYTNQRKGTENTMASSNVDDKLKNRYRK